MKAINIAEAPKTSIEQIKQNMKAREEAEQFFQMIGDQPPRFWEVLVKLAMSKLQAAQERRQPPMDEQEAIKFEKVIITFGKYTGYEVGEIKCEYLVWLAEGDDFIKNLRRYIASATFRRRQDEESLSRAE